MAPAFGSPDGSSAPGVPFQPGSSSGSGEALSPITVISGAGTGSGSWVEERAGSRITTTRVIAAPKSARSPNA
ncbi:hypothetical protein D7I43_10625 [Micromonospora globbae]|uniref:Uncharacterized protein n=1 Tax=Micromonospora globbae TaxID=1894969 RepID=A0A420F3J5_9ACTN|nr:hypothetical protein D7I43_10625 [Micromonospora globbae]